jgi:hypothetical protein
LQKARHEELKKRTTRPADKNSGEPAHVGRSRYTRLAWLGAAAAIAGVLFVSQRNSPVDVKSSAALPRADSGSKTADRGRAETQLAAAAPQAASRAAETKPQEHATSQQTASTASAPSRVAQASTSAGSAPSPESPASTAVPAQAVVPAQPGGSAPPAAASAQTSGTAPAHTASTPHPEQTPSAKTRKTDPSSAAVATATANAPPQIANARHREAENVREATRDARAAQLEREPASRASVPVAVAQRAAPPVVTPSVAPVRAEPATAEAPAGPRLVINVRNESQRAWAEQIVRPLGERGIRVVGIRVVSSGPDHPDLRYFNLSDRNEVVRIAVALRDFGLRAQQLKHLDDSGSPSSDRRYELWLPAGP